MKTIYEQLVDCKIERAENRIRELHNDLESKKIFGKKNFMQYDSSKFISMIKDVRNQFNK